jgi:hypothetical protein
VAACGIPGEPRYFAWRSGDRVVGIAAGVQHACRLAPSLRHIYLPTLPAAFALSERAAAISSLIGFLKAGRVAELTCDSRHAAGRPPACPAPRELRWRHEYVVRLNAPPDKLLERWGVERRRQLETTVRAGWRLITPTGEAAADTIADVWRDADGQREHRADDLFGGEPALDLALGATALDCAWGRAVFAAFEGGRPLAFAVIGWGNRRAYYLSGAVTRAGRERPVTTWLHWRIMGELYERGFTSYGLGGARASATNADDGVHGLHCYRTSFGAEAVPCAGARWVLDPTHEAAHHSPARPMRACFA